MCFSATASFTAGVALSTVGAVTIKKARKRSELPFAAIPLLFGIQQIIEGIVWISLAYEFSSFAKIATYSFVFFAYVVWPVLVPFALMLLEKNSHRKKILQRFLYLGSAVSAYLLYFMLTNVIQARVIGESIAYTSPYQYGIFIVGAYVAATCISCFFSSHKVVKVLGALIAISFTVSYFFYTFSYASVWCFFAAVLSSIIYLYFDRHAHA